MINRHRSGRLFLLLTFLGVMTCMAMAQESPKAPTRAERMAKLQDKMVYPLIKGSYLSGIIPVENITNKPAPGKEVKLIFDFTHAAPNNAQATMINAGLEEVARIMNLHIAAGVKKEKLKTVIIFHAGSVPTILNNAFYQEKYKIDNPNLNLLRQMTAAGTELIICGQSLHLRDLSQDKLLPEIQIALSAKSTLSKYQGEGYIPFPINDEH